MAQTKDDLEARNKATVEVGFGAWRNGTGSPYDLLADDATWTIVGNSLVSRTYTSREEFLAYFDDELRATYDEEREKALVKASTAEEDE